MSYTIEQQERIRIVMGERMKTLRNRIKNFKTQPNMNDEARKKNIAKTEEEFAEIAYIEAIAMREISKTILKS